MWVQALPAPHRIRGTASLLPLRRVDQSAFREGSGKAPFSERRPSQRYPSKNLASASRQSGRGVKPASRSLALERRLFMGRRALERPYSCVLTGSTRVGAACLAEDFAGEVVPADEATLVGGVVIAVFVGLDHVDQQPRQIPGIGRRADLVVRPPAVCRASRTASAWCVMKLLAVAGRTPRRCAR